MTVSAIRPQFDTFIPEDLLEGVLYISEPYSTAIHLCCCGCGEQVVTPLSSAEWHLRKHEEGRVSLHPSIGNWDFPCQSHYWIRNNRVQWAAKMTPQQINRVKQRDEVDRQRQIARTNAQRDAEHRPTEAPAPSSIAPQKPSLTDRVWGFIVKLLG